MSEYLGIDVGGSSIKFSLMDDSGQPTGQPFSIAHSGHDSRGALEVGLHRALTEGTPSAVGIGSPGYLSVDRKHVLFAANLGWSNFPIVDFVSQIVGVPAFLDGDAQVAALAELRLGAARQAKSALYLSLGTGIGCSVIVGGKVLAGAHGMAGNAGHSPVARNLKTCACGKSGCWETVASAKALIDMSEKSPLDFYAACQQADADALVILDEWVEWLALGLTPLLGLLDPQRVIIGGAISEYSDLFVERLAVACSSHLLGADYVGVPEFVPAQRGAQAGVLGAALLAIDGMARLAK